MPVKASPLRRASAIPTLHRTGRRPDGDIATALSISDRAILALLTFGEKSGWDLWQFAERTIGFIWAPAKSQVYRVLPRLTELGLTAAHRVKQTKYPDKQVYRLTDEGRRVVTRWLEEVDVNGDPDEHLLKILFAREMSRPVRKLQIAAYRDAMAARLAVFEGLNRRLPRNEPNRFPLHVLALGMQRCRAGVDWADALLAGTEVRDAGRPPRPARPPRVRAERTVVRKHRRTRF